MRREFSLEENCSVRSLKIFEAIELYLSRNESLNEETKDFDSIRLTEKASLKENESLSLAEISEILQAIESDLENERERNETLDALTFSLRQVAEQSPLVVENDRTEQQNDGTLNELGQIVVRAVFHEVLTRIFTFYLLTFFCWFRFSF